MSHRLTKSDENIYFFKSRFLPKEDRFSAVTKSSDFSVVYELVSATYFGDRIPKLKRNKIKKVKTCW